MSENNILAVILSGGQSKRMGEDKVMLKINDITLIEHTINKIKNLLPNIIIISDKNIDYVSSHNLPVIEDCIKGNQGPLIGILSAMRWAKKSGKEFSWIVTFPCDTPFFPKDIVKKFIDLSNKKKFLLYFASSKGQRHNIFGLWSIKLYEKLENDILNNNSRKVQDWAEKNNVQTIEFNFKDFDPFFNINTKEDLKIARELYKKNKK